MRPTPPGGRPLLLSRSPPLLRRCFSALDSLRVTAWRIIWRARLLLALHLAGFLVGLLCHRFTSPGLLWDLCDASHRMLELGSKALDSLLGK